MTVTLCTPTFEHHRETLGIGELSPRISWRFTSDGDTKNWTQESYEVEIYRSPSIKPETFQIQSDESVLVPWPSTPLKSRERVRLRVRATGRDSHTTSWSDFVDVEAGLQREDWAAQVITAENTITTNGALQPTLFRKSFQVKKKITSARLYITSYGVYEATINGVQVGNHVLAPGWTSYNYRLLYQTYDVTALLKSGENTIGVEVGEGWYCGRLGFEGGKRFIYGDQLAAFAQIEIRFEDEEKLIVASDGSWKSFTGPIISSELYDGEVYDSSLEVKGWASSEFQDTEWKPVQILDFPKAMLLAPQGPPIRKIEILKPKKIWRSPSNKVIVDFGQNLVGGVRFRTTGPKGHKIVLTHTEVLEHEEVATRPLRDCRAKDTILLSGEDIEWEPKFTFHGFQYVQVEGWPSETGEPSVENIEAVVIHTDMEPTGWFECSESMVNQLYQNIRWGMRGNFVGIPTDCPQRDERLGWTGDIQIFSPTANFLYDTSGMLWSWLQDLSLEQIEEFNGVVPQVVPNVIEARLNSAQAVWGDVAVITPWDLFLNFGDKSILESQFQSMQTWWVRGIPRQANGLWDDTRHQLGDWLDPAAPPSSPADGKTDPHFIANAYAVHTTQLIYQIASILGRSQDEINIFGEASVSLKSRFQQTYITPVGRLAPDTMTSLSLALEFDLFRTPQEAEKARARLARLSRASRFRIGTGFVGTPIILPALSSGGDKNYKQVAYRMLLEKRCPSWLYPITMGATTMWERWDSMLPNGDINPGSMTSFNHYALGSVGKWLFGCVGGVDLQKAENGNDVKGVGWRKIKFAPMPGGSITKAKTSHLGPYGMISCEWELDVSQKLFKMIVVVPPNSTGVVELPGKGKSDLIEIGSGKWDFECVGYEETQEWPPKAILDPFAMYEGEEEKERLGR